MEFALFSWKHLIFAIKATATTISILFAVIVLLKLLQFSYLRNGELENASKIAHLTESIWQFIMSVGAAVERFLEGNKHKNK